MRLGKQQLADWLDEHRTLWWWVADVTKLSDESILEGVMNYGDWKDFLQLEKWWGLSKIRSLFEKMTSQRRINLRPPVRVLFRDYLTYHVDSKNRKNKRTIPNNVFINSKKDKDVLTIAAMKVYSLGQRAKWKDYVDLYFIFQKYSLSEVVNRAKKLFPNQINERLLREQLDYFADIDYSETVEYLLGMAVSDDVVKEELKKIAIS